MKESKRSSSSFKEVTEVISRNIMPNHEKDYDDWLERFMRSEEVSRLSWNYHYRPWG